MCLGVTGTTVGTVVMSVVITARMSGTGVAGGGSAISGSGTEQLRCLFRCSLGFEQHMWHVAQARILGVEHGGVHLCGLPNDGVAHRQFVLGGRLGGFK